ncbi:MAG: nucleoside hydrolase, partial [Steroidobacteraceae bacterium]
AELRVVTSSFLNPQFPAPDGKQGATAAAGRALAEAVVAQVRPARRPLIAGGAERALADVAAPQDSAAARAIVAEALREDPLPLYCTCGGPLTNVASALLLEPRIAERMTVVWIGGAGYPQGGWEYNLASDVRAAQVVFNHCNVPLWQVPQPAYRSCQLAIAEMETDFAAAGATGRWLLRQFQGMRPDWLKLGGTWPMGDSPLVLATALSSESSELAERPAPLIADDMRYGEAAGARTIRVYGRIDFRLLLGDFLARLRLHAGAAR